MDKRIKMSEKDMINYYIREQKALEYGTDFFEDICRMDIKTIENKILPLCFYNQMDEFLYSLDIGDRMAIRGGFCHAGDKQAYIRIGIDTTNSILNKNFKQIIRHEIIHYYLWLVDLPFDDNSLEFWCMCYAFDAGAYEELEYDDEEYYEKFVELYKKYAEPFKNKGWVYSVMIGQMIVAINESSIEEYEDKIIQLSDQCNKLCMMK